MKGFLSILGLVGVGLLGRLVPHPPNTTPVTAIAFAAAKYVGSAWAIAIPLFVMVLTDLIIGFYDWKVLVSVYGSVAIIGGIGMLAKRARPPVVILLVMASSALFFLVTNFAVWAASSWYPPTFEGLVASYVAGLPFLRNMFIGDVFYAASLLGVFEWVYAAARHRTQGIKVDVDSSETAVI
ncbi:MAG TPA: DUF6580 family putative transport protein [Candidatus Paceibacterota bacterium]|nr:DUF6580 family putative transport protein [Candidatus Paceibacterota bacterium]